MCLVCVRPLNDRFWSGKGNTSRAKRTRPRKILARMKTLPLKWVELLVAGEQLPKRNKSAKTKTATPEEFKKLIRSVTRVKSFAFDDRIAFVLDLFMEF